MRAKAALYCKLSSCLGVHARVRIGSHEGTTNDVQSNQSRLQTMFQEYSLLLLGPRDVILQYLNLNLLTVRNGGKEIQEGSNC